MAITILSDTDYDPIFKRHYLKLQDNLYNSYGNVWSVLKKVDGLGKSAYNPVEVTFGGGVGSSSDGTLPQASSTKFLNPVYEPKRVYARMQLDGMIIEASKTSEDAFVKAVDQETTGKLRSFNRYLQGCVLFNDATGILGQFSGSQSGTAAAPEVTVLNSGTYLYRKAFFEVGDLINVNQLTTVWKITAVNHSTRVITLSRLSGADDLTAIGVGTHSIYMQNSRNNDPMGFKGIIDNSTHYGVAEQTRWQPTEVDANSAPLDTDMLTELVENYETDTDEEPTHLVFSPTQWKKYKKILEDQKRWPVPVEFKPRKNAMTSDQLIARVSFSGIEFAGRKEIICMKSKFVQEDRVYAINTNHIYVRHLMRPGWQKRDGTVLMRMEDRDAYEARLAFYGQIDINPFYVGAITGISTT